MENRRSPRVAVARPVTLSGTDASGLQFRETTTPVDGVSRHGTRLSTSHRLGIGAQVMVGNPLLGQSAAARVVRVVEKGQIFEIGIELSEPRDLWGVAISPEERKQAANPVAAARNDPSTSWSLPERLRLRRRHRLRRSEVGLDAAERGTAAVEPAVPEVSLAAENEDTIVTRPGTPEVAAEGSASLHPQVPEKGHDGEGSSIGLPLPAAGTSLELESVRRFFEASRGELQKMLAQTQEVQRQSWQALESSFEEMQAALQDELEAASQRAAEEARRNVQRDVCSALEAFQQQARGRLQTLVDETLARSRELQQKAELSLKGYAEEQKRLSESGASTLDHLQRQSETWMQSLREDLQKSHDELKVSGVNRIAGQLRETMEQLATELQQRAEAAFADLDERVKQSQTALASECEQRVIRAAQEASSSAEGRLKEAQERLDSCLQQSLEAFRAQLGEVSKSALREFRTAAGTLMGDVHTRLDQAARAFAQLSAAAADLKKPLE